VTAYTRLVRPLLFRADPERAHEWAVRAAELASRRPVVCRALASRVVADERLVTEVAGLRFPSPLGLAAGFDKSARGVPALSSLGFGHVEIGSVSCDPSDGNPRPRLWRLPEERAIVVHYGVPNDGALRVGARLAPGSAAVPVGINVVSTNRGDTEAESDEAVIADYVRAVGLLAPLADYVCLNLSCPNTRDGRGFFADRSRLRELLDRLVVERPLFVKVAPFARAADLDSFLAAADAGIVTGFSVNLPPGERGAVSGPPAAAAALRTVTELYRAGGRPVIGSGGVSSAADAWRMVRAGASLVQVYTALVYEGPGLVRRTTRELGSLVTRDGFGRVGDAVGTAADAL
jgi:dihydroorotate dehydrogenase (fumarate)/dihydroorotate dehydrogenase